MTTVNIQGHFCLRFRDGRQLPPLNFDTTCITFWRYDFSSMKRYIVMTINDIYVNNLFLSMKKYDNKAVLLDFHSLYQTMDRWPIRLCVIRTDLSYLPWTSPQLVSHQDVTLFSTMNDMKELPILKTIKLGLFLPNYAKSLPRVEDYNT